MSAGLEMAPGAILVDGPKYLLGVQCTECHGRPIEIRLGVRSQGTLLVLLTCTSCGRSADAIEMTGAGSFVIAKTNGAAE